MDNLLGGLFGGGDADEPQRRQARDFVDRYMTGDPTEGYGEDEALDQFRRVSQQASPEQMERATRRALEHLPENQRAEFAEMLRRRQAGRGMVEIERTGGGRSGGAGIDDLLGGLMGGGSGGAGGLGGMLGGLLGGGLGGGSTRGRSYPGGSRGDDDMFGGLGDLLSSPAGKAVIGGIAAFAMKEMLDRR